MSITSPYCFVCGKENPKGLKVNVFFEDDIAKTKYVFDSAYQGWTGIIHGGLISTLLDEVMAYAVAYRLGPAVTTHLEVTFRNPLRPKEEFIASGWVVKNTSRKAEAEAEIKRIKDNVIIATARATLLLINKRLRT